MFPSICQYGISFFLLTEVALAAERTRIQHTSLRDLEGTLSSCARYWSKDKNSDALI